MTKNIINFLLVVMAILLTYILLLPLYIVRVFSKIGSPDKFSDFNFNLALNLDYVGASIIDGTDGHTLSANSIKLNKPKRNKFINLLFRDKLHCEKAYLREYTPKE